MTAAGAADATTVLRKNLDELVREADAIVVGTVTDLQAQYDGSGTIQSFVTLADLQVIHGDYPEASLTLRLEGGRVGPHMQAVIGSPRFRPHERVLVFVQGNGQYLVPIVGWTQGVFRLTFDPGTGRERIFDHDQNPVLGIRGSELLKRQGHRAAAGIAGGSPSDAAGTQAESPALDADGFLAEVARRAGLIGARGRTLRSVPLPPERLP